MTTKVWERKLFVGSLKDAEQLASANPMKIAAVLSLCSEEIERRNPSIRYMRVVIPDAQPIPKQQFKEIMGAIEDGLRRGNLLLHCAAGFSRSPIIAAAWMHRRGYDRVAAALAEMARLRDIDPSPALLRSVKERLNR